MTTTNSSERPSIEALMKAMPASWAEYWCEGGACCCLGCANISGGLIQFGYSKADWEAYQNAVKKAAE